ncbi:protease [Chrysothrix chrysovirus 1]|uniref:Protease n=1 Tax=Chrysothrix chrysovirus 1 TaxID=2682569 RepID=A0A650D827_9VIRU|nr:protease [Chrysothrix chrysovirus 1]QGR26541.1 protease [Chrysothrix chrysovirus 1]
MSAVNRVVDYMRGMPENANHRETYASNVMARLSTEKTEVIDCVEEEKNLISHGEKEIISRLKCQAKFTRANMFPGVNINSMVTYGQKGDVNRIKNTEIDFIGSREWFLEPARSRALYSKRESTMHLLDEQQKRQIMSQCPNMSSQDVGSLHQAAVHERLSIPTDMRHIFMKIYLMLMDYNLACTSMCEDICVRTDIIYDLRNHLPAAARMATITDHDIVVEGDLFTEQELGLLCLAGAEYPSVWYAGDNMYNKIQMEADDVVVVSEKGIAIDMAVSFDSPERMCNLAWSLASKLGCIPCWCSAIENMRGKPKQVADLMEYVEGNTINSLIPTSFNLSTSFGKENKTYSLTKMSGYISTSYSLIADLLYGMVFKAAISCSIESIGGCGTLLSSSTPKTNLSINGSCREFGYQHSSSDHNAVLSDWERLMRKPVTWDYGKYLKEYALGVAEQIVNGLDIIMPQLLITVHSLLAFDTSLDMETGWLGDADMLNSTKNERGAKADGLAALSWVSGLRAVRPRVFFNKRGNKSVALSASEQHLSAELDDRGLKDVGFWVNDTLGGRVDENEIIGSVLINTEYPGTKCAMVYSYAESQWVEVSNKEYDEYVRQSTHGDIRPSVPLKRTTDKDPIPVVWGSGTKDKRFERNIEHLKTLSPANAIKPDKEGRHHRIGSDGTAYVPEYVADGEISTTPLVYKKPIIREEGPLQYKKVEVAGDGQCGIHAVVKDLEMHGRIGAGDTRKTEAIFTEGIASKSFQDAQELAALCQQWGFGMMLADKETGSVTNYNDGTQDQIVCILRENGHFSPIILDEGENRMDIRRIHNQEIPSDEFVNKVREYGSLFSR